MRMSAEAATASSASCSRRGAANGSGATSCSRKRVRRRIAGRARALTDLAGECIGVLACRNLSAVVPRGRRGRPPGRRGAGGGARRGRRAHRPLRECRRRHGREPRVRRRGDAGRRGLDRRARRHAVDRAVDDRARRRGDRRRRRRRRAVLSTGSAGIRWDSAPPASPTLAALTGDDGAKSVVASHRDGLVRIDVDDAGTLRDVDRPSDLA